MLTSDLIYMFCILLSQTTAELLYAVLTAHVKSTFHKINVHAAMTPTDIHNYFQPVFQQARALRKAFERKALHEQEAALTQAALLESKKRESLGRKPMASIRSLAIAAQGSLAAVMHSPSSSSVESLASTASGPGVTPTTPVGAGISPMTTYPPASNRAVPFVTVSFACTLCTCIYMYIRC